MLSREVTGSAFSRLILDGRRVCRQGDAKVTTALLLSSYVTLVTILPATKCKPYHVDGLHVVGAHEVALEILNTQGPLKFGGVVHSFSGSAEVALRYINLNLHLGVTARWSLGGAKKLRAALCEVDVSSLLLESDAPDQSAIKNLRNDPTAIIDAAAWVAEQKGLTTNGVLVQCSKNAAALFG